MARRSKSRRKVKSKHRSKSRRKVKSRRRKHKSRRKLKMRGGVKKEDASKWRGGSAPSRNAMLDFYKRLRYSVETGIPGDPKSDTRVMLYLSGIIYANSLARLKRSGSELSEDRINTVWDMAFNYDFDLTNNFFNSIVAQPTAKKQMEFLRRRYLFYYRIPGIAITEF